jgi:hypothetical protein
MKRRDDEKERRRLEQQGIFETLFTFDNTIKIARDERRRKREAEKKRKAELERRAKLRGDYFLIYCLLCDK